MNAKEKAKLLNKKWKKMKDGKLMKSLFMFVCDDLELLEELYKDDKDNKEVLNLLKDEANKKYNGDFKKLYIKDDNIDKMNM